MITKERISNWVANPHELQEIHAPALQQLTLQYPYFIPVLYCNAIKSHLEKQEPIAPLQQLYEVNPILLHGILQKAKQPAQVVTEHLVVEEVQLEEELLIVEGLGAVDYFTRSGIEVSSDMPDAEGLNIPQGKNEEKDLSLMVVMTFEEWLKYLKLNTRKAKEEEEDKKALKHMWQQQKLAAAIEEENEEIPENVFEMAVNSIAKTDELISESLAEVYAKQGKARQAIDMYKKLILQNPDKNTYFAGKIASLQKEL